MKQPASTGGLLLLHLQPIQNFMIMGHGYLLHEIEKVLAAFYENAEQDDSGSTSADKIEQVLKLSEVFKVNLSDTVFRIRKERQVYLVIEKYHNALVLLMDEALERAQFVNRPLQDQIYSILDDLLYFLEKRFSAYLNLDLELPPHYVTLSKRTWPERLERLSSYFSGTEGENLFNFVGSNLLRFINARRHKHLSHRALLYRKEIISEIELLAASPKMIDAARGLHELLMYMNYNSKGYLEVYTMEIAALANAYQDTSEREYFLQKKLQALKRLYCNTAIGLHTDKEPIKGMVRAWFKDQLSLFSQNLTDRVEPYGKVSHSYLPAKTATVNDKIYCTFSSAVLAILLRALEQAGLIKVPSLSRLYKVIVPFLSTARKPELSVDSVRSKSYLFDDKTREDAIHLLEKMIDKIRKM